MSSQPQPALPIAPKSHKAAIENPTWYKTMETKDLALKVKKTWHLVPLDPSRKVISNKWVFRVKTKADDTLDKLKARFVARGFEQMAGVDHRETLCTIIKFTTNRLIFTLAASRKWSIQQIDVNHVILNGDLEETISMVQTKGFEDPNFPSYVCKLDKAL